MIKKFDVANIIIYLQKETTDQSRICDKIRHDKKKIRIVDIVNKSVCIYALIF